MTEREWISIATRFTIGVGVPPKQCQTAEDYPVHIERCDQRDGITQLWAVRRMLECLAVDGEWEHEPIPSSRDEAWRREHRFASKEGAYGAAMRALGKPCSCVRMMEVDGAGRMVPIANCPKCGGSGCR